MTAGWIMIAVGLWTIIGVVILNIGMNTRRAQRMVGFIGTGGTKVVYTIIGVAALVYGILILTGSVSW